MVWRAVLNARAEFSELARRRPIDEILPTPPELLLRESGV
jgi:hypothetical protein